jgi:enamine deaminase RidA (YjgF/YER057c/UK114 family)
MSEPQRANNRRKFLSEGVAAGLAGGALVGLAAQQAGAAQVGPSQVKLNGLHPDGAPADDSGYTPGILAEGVQKVIFVSGQGPEDYDADMETQMRQTFQRIGKVLAASGASFENIVILRSFFVHMARNLPAYRKVRKEFLKQPYPASTAVGTTELAIPGLEIEIEAVAVL